ncbi:MAG TPA: SDR family NAD(P)-dependent oxidoreductase [Sphingomonas sp.]|nr:SDR family NAD(P)-dependent oxidoreductase [Sphingomonas sp.]
MTGISSIMITGASSGLGAGLAKDYAAPGIRLVLSARDGARLEETARACRDKGASVVTGLFDVGEAEPLGAWLVEQDAAVPFDLVIAAAGVSGGTGEGDEPEGVSVAAMQVRANLLGTIHTIEPLLPRMIARGHGHVALIASTAALRGLPYSPAYSASKAGVRTYGEALRALLRPQGVTVTVVVPGFFDTPMTDRWKGPTPFMLSLDKMVAAIRKGLDARRARIVVPRLLAFGCQMADLMPAALGDAIMRGFRFRIEPGR